MVGAYLSYELCRQTRAENELIRVGSGGREFLDEPYIPIPRLYSVAAYVCSQPDESPTFPAGRARVVPELSIGNVDALPAWLSTVPADGPTRLSGTGVIQNN